MLQGQAGVWAVASKLAMNNVIPLFPGVDLGYDLFLENGLRLQVRSAMLTQTQNENRLYPYLTYIFKLTRDNWYSEERRKKEQHVVTKPFSQVADYFVLWGADENRFFIIPTNIGQKSIYFPARSYTGNSFVRRVNGARLAERLASYEDRWDLLNISDTSKELIESAAEISFTGEPNAISS
jgi:hypothetical protein